MQPNPLQNFLESFANHFQIDLRFIGARLHVKIDGRGELVVENVSLNRVLVVQRFEHEDGMIETPIAIIFVGSPQWIPIALRSDTGSVVGGEITEDGTRIECVREAALVCIADTCSQWGNSLLSGPWIEGKIVAIDRGDEAVAEDLVAALLNNLGIIVEASR